MTGGDGRGEWGRTCLPARPWPGGPQVAWGLPVRRADGCCFPPELVEAGCSQNRRFRKWMQRNKRVGTAPIPTWLTPTREHTHICLHTPCARPQIVPWGKLHFPPLKH